jgi:hypothetical protein
MKNGSAVPLVRSDATQALGIAENNLAEGTFYSLGFGGSLVVKFDNGVSGGVAVTESTFPGYPVEKAKVEMSTDGTHWSLAGTVSQSGTVAMPKRMSCALYVRITDTSVKSQFPDATADGYDVDGIRSVSDQSCTPTTGGGNGGDTTVKIKNVTVCNTIQTSATVIGTEQSSTANTGGNGEKNTTGTGSSTLTTGNATSTNTTTIVGGSNISTSDCGCCGTGNTTVTIGN